MDWRLSGQDQAVLLMFKFDGQFVVPDGASVRLTVRGNDGAALAGATLPETIDSTQTTVTVPAASNSLPDGKLFETRYVRLDFTVNGVPSFAQSAYRIHRFIPHAVDADAVRALVGADSQELPDNDIDPISAYFSLLSEHGSKITQALSNSDVTCLAANKAIALRTAIDLCPSLPSRLVKMEKADTSQFQRVDMDFKKLEDDLRAQLVAALDVITTGTVGVSTVTEIPTFFVVTNQTDRITGGTG